MTNGDRAKKAAAAAQLLAGASVLEVSGRVAGAYCGRQLAAMGAAVSRVELPLSAHAPEAVLPALEAALARGKQPVDAARAAQLTESADLMLVDLGPGDGSAAHCKLAAALVARRGERPLLTLPHFAAAGADAGRPGAPLTVGAATGAAWSIGDPGREPLSLPFDIPDALAGAEGAAAAALMLGAAAPEAAPSRIEVAAAEVLASYVGMISRNFVPYGRPWHRDGPQASRSGGSYPAAIFACADGAVAIMCRQAREWDGLLAAMGDPDWAELPGRRDARLVAREHAEEVDPLVRAWIGDRTYAELVALGREHGFPVAAVRDVAATLDDEQYVHRGFFERLDPADPGSPLVPGLPFEVAATSAPAPAPARRPRPSRRAPLADLRVLDFTWVWSGPTVTAALRDLGADVIKVENSARPDSARARGNALRDGVPIEGPPLETSTYFSAVNRGKRSIEVDITSAEGRELLLRLVRECDVVAENMRPGALARRGLGYEELAAANPSLVMLSMSTAGRDGPQAATGGYAPVMSGLAGLEALIAYPDSPPMGLFNLALADPNGAAHALAALLAALRRRRRSGEGCWIDLSQMEAASCLLTEPLLEAQLLGATTPPANSHPRFHPHGHFAAAGGDAWLAVAVRDADERRHLRELIGAGDEADLEAALAAWARERDPDAAAAELATAGIPASPVRSYEQVEAGERLAAGPVEHPYIGSERIGALGWALDGEHLRPRGPAPLLGEHTEQVLAELAGTREEAA